MVRKKKKPLSEWNNAWKKNPNFYAPPEEGIENALCDPPEIEAMRTILRCLGLADEPGMEDTPKRVIKFLKEFRQQDGVPALLRSKFACDSKDMVIQKDIPFRGLCEHHLLPYFGKAHIGYIPDKWVLGLSKIARIVENVGCQRPSIQERQTVQLAKIFYGDLESRGSIVVVEAEHTCMTCRGVRTPGVKTITSSVKGVFRDVPAARDEFFNLIRQ